MLKRILIIALLSLILMQCARRGSPSGGPIDETPPKVVRLEPNQKTLNFNSDRIRIYFDEYIKLNELRDQLVVSPPLEQSKYLISPQGLPAKYLQIEFTDSLPSNTTYTFNFGQSIVDNNEGNVLPFYKYIFSTGNSLDSLSIS
ncbi:MAG: Ig-like domain-containing protein, partial [Bacteroidota bacterium]|nr:Ig-like domain-containing protein [Bacteroidota bacterium]